MAISNHRLLDVGEGRVRFTYRDRARGDVKRTATLIADEFIRRFLRHVLPKGLQRIRHYGFLSHRTKSKALERCGYKVEEGVNNLGLDVSPHADLASSVAFRLAPVLKKSPMVIAKEIHQALRKRFPTMSLSTVYNTLDTLERIGEIQSLHIFDDFLNYEANVSPHVHFHCRKCGAIHDIFTDERTDFAVPTGDIDGHEVTSYSIVLGGTCKLCR